LFSFYSMIQRPQKINYTIAGFSTLLMRHD
jgi:hypothetical protein